MVGTVLVYEWVNVRQYCEALWIKARYKCNPCTVYRLPLQVLKQEVELMSKMAKTIDGFTQNQTRMAVIIDGLDACEQDRVLQMLDTVSTVQVSQRFFVMFLGYLPLFNCITRL